jgi:hypothetical protein
VVHVDPQKIHFNEVMVSQGAKQTITVTGRQSDFQITGVEGDSKIFGAQVVKTEPVQEDGQTLQRVTLEVSLAKDAEIGNHQFAYALKTNDPRVPSVQLNISAGVVGDLRASPPGMLVKTMTASTQFQSQVQIDTRLGTPFEITSVDVEGPDAMNLVVDYEPESVDGRQVYVVRLSGVTPSSPGQVRGIVTVKTNLKDNNEVKINWVAAVRGVDPQAGRPTGISPTTRPATNAPTTTTAPSTVGPQITPVTSPTTAPSRPATPTTAPSTVPAPK